MDILQGPHQVAQNSTTYTFPFSRVSTGVPLTHFATAMGGASDPTFSVGKAALATVEAAAVIANRISDHRTA